MANRSEVSWENDNWLSQLLKKPCMRPSQKPTDSDTSVADPNLPGFYAIKTKTAHHDIVRDLFHKKFNLIDLHIAFHLEGPLDSQALTTTRGLTIHRAERQHIPLLQSIAVESFSDSRFHRDPHISNGLADKVWQQWTNDAVEDKDRIVLFAQRDQNICGFISLRPCSDGCVSIDLFGVAKKFRREGVGELLIRSISSFAGRPAGILLETEVSNTSALNFYGRLGFKTNSLFSIFHFHRNEPS